MNDTFDVKVKPYIVHESSPISVFETPKNNQSLSCNKVDYKMNGINDKKGMFFPSSKKEDMMKVLQDLRDQASSTTFKRSQHP
jgi:hypothetical protein